MAPRLLENLALLHEPIHVCILKTLEATFYVNAHTSSRPVCLTMDITWTERIVTEQTAGQAKPLLADKLRTWNNNSNIYETKGAKTSDSRWPWWQNFVIWGWIFMGRQHVTLLVSRILGWLLHFQKIVHPWYNPLGLWSCDSSYLWHRFSG